MHAKEYGSRADKTRIEVCDILEDLYGNLEAVLRNIDDIRKTLWNEEYEDDEGYSI